MDLRLLLIAIWCPQFLSAFTWIDDHGDPGYNCLGKVVDAICCKDSFCKAASETECKEGNKQFLCSWTGSKCISFRDDKNNVCCKSGTADACAKIVQGVCPDNWQVPNGCCSPDSSKYNGTLVGVKPGYVCCNAPCAEMTKSGCPLPDSCAPKARAYVQQGNVNYNLGFYQSPLNYAQNALTGKIIPGFGYGFGGDYGKSVLDSMGFGSSKDSQVDEITVDDLMSLLIDSLADDKDAMVYNSELTSDPFLGKTKSGGSIASMNLPNPNIFLDRIYGSPFGLSQGQMGNYPSLSSPYDSFYGGMNTGYSGYGYQGYPAQYSQQPYQAWPQTSYSSAQYGYAQQPQSQMTQYGVSQQAASQYVTPPQPQYMVQQAQLYAPQQPQYAQYTSQQLQYAPQQAQAPPQPQYAPQQVQQQYAPPQAQAPPQPQYSPQQVQPQYAPQQAQAPPQPQYAPQQAQAPPQPQYAPQQAQAPPQPQYAPQQAQAPPQQQFAPQQAQAPQQPQYAPQQAQAPPQQQFAPQQAQAPPPPQYAPQQAQAPPQQQFAPQQALGSPPQPQYAGSPPTPVQNIPPTASAPQVQTTPPPKPPQAPPAPAAPTGPIYKSP